MHNLEKIQKQLKIQLFMILHLSTILQIFFKQFTKTLNNFIYNIYHIYISKIIHYVCPDIVEEMTWSETCSN